MRFAINIRNKKIILKVKKCNWFKRIIGLMFTRREKAEALLFDFNKPVRFRFHSFFVFFPFVAIWLDDKDKIIEFKIIKPFKINIYSRKLFVKVIEIPINEKYKEIIKLLCS